MAKKMRSFGGKSLGKPAAGNQKPKMNQILQQAQQAQEEFQKKEDEFKAREFDFSVGGGALTIKMSGEHKLLNIEFDEDLLEEIDDFKDLIMAAVNQGVEDIEKQKEEYMGSIGASMGLPDLGF
ncbi:MAG TPA: YbaB/EbfC family nucleoid-associated protein [Thermotogota bacterium]|nr:YbaB/EbfC family nucleoid-associated protein [Thermotogota bacterium]HPJ87497.1 YbaB/EbfC family nucleoid-associated protein [Thermotogota bacterium]HPR94702.1 YbaB/EbfC family nucleoid-associated protein [Thermotogota bacterium]